MQHECVPIHRRLVKRSATIETRHRRLYRLLSPDVLPQSADHPRMHAYLSKHDMEMNEKLSNEDTLYCIKKPNLNASLVYLRFDLFRCVSQKYCWVRITGRHFRLGTLQRWEKCRMNECRFGESEARCYVSCHSKVWILIDGAGYQTVHFLLAEYEWKCGWKCGSSLYSWKCNFSNRIRITKTKNAFHLIECDTLLDANQILIEGRRFSTQTI